MPIAMEESSNYKCSESHQSGGFFAVTKGKESLLDKLKSMKNKEFTMNIPVGEGAEDEH